MKVFYTCLLLLVAGLLHSQPLPKVGDDKIFASANVSQQPSFLPSDTLIRSEADMLQLIRLVDESYTIGQLRNMVAFCAQRYTKSENIARELAHWLRENHPLYTQKSPSEASRFKCFLLYTLGAFAPTPELFASVKNELQFSSYPSTVTAAAATAKLFPQQAEEIVPLFIGLLQNSSQKEWIDITTTDLNYPLLHPTTLAYESLKTLSAFGKKAYPSITLLKQLVLKEKQVEYDKDTLLLTLAQQAIDTIVAATPVCCRNDTTLPETAYKKIMMRPVKDRRTLTNTTLSLLDQNGEAIKFNQLIGKPFVLSFFYTSCSNPLKCASTVDRLAKLEKWIAEKKMNKKLGVYGITYDPDVDNPAVLHNYGTIYGLNFSSTVKFLSPQYSEEKEFFRQLNLRVNYGYATINQHGIQLFIFDKKGRLAAIADNELWKVEDVGGLLQKLAKE